MAPDVSGAGLWLYRHVRRTGVLSLPPARRAFELVYGRYKRHFEDPFWALTRRHPSLFTGGHILDVGANIGYTAGVFAAAIQPGFQVLAFEPSSENFHHLQRSIAQQGLAHVIVARRAGIADRAGTMELVLNPDHPGDHHMAPSAGGGEAAGGAVERVPVITVDEAVRSAGASPIAFIKIDVQGYELHVCRGMIATLEANPAAAVVLEYSPDSIRQYGGDPEGISRVFAPRGYAAYRVTQRGRLEALDVHALPGALPAPGYIDILFTRAAPSADPA
jgi:FkbM family methyltransferase